MNHAKTIERISVQDQCTYAEFRYDGSRYRLQTHYGSAGKGYDVLRERDGENRVAGSVALVPAELDRYLGACKASLTKNNKLLLAVAMLRIYEEHDPEKAGRFNTHTEKAWAAFKNAAGTVFDHLGIDLTKASVEAR